MRRIALIPREIVIEVVERARQVLSATGLDFEWVECGAWARVAR